MTTEYKLVICDVRDDSLISQHTPDLGVDWLEVPGTRQTAGQYYQADFAARVPSSRVEHLPEHCYVDDRFIHVTKLNVTYCAGEEVLEVCYQEEEGLPIQAQVF